MEENHHLVGQQQARSRIYSLLAAGFLYPDKEFHQELFSRKFQTELQKNLDILYSDHPKDLSRLRASSLSELQEEYIRLFSAGSPCPAYQTEYLSPHIFSKTQTLADISGFYQAFGLETGSRQRERGDFLGAELEFMSYLCFKAALARSCRREDDFEISLEAQKKFLQQHLLRWGRLFCSNLEVQATCPLYKSLARLLSSFLGFEENFLKISAEPAADPLTGPALKFSAPDSGCPAC